MKKIKILLFIFVLFLIPHVFAKEVIDYIQYNTDYSTGTYKGDEIALGGYSGPYSVKTRYQGRLSFIEFVLSSNYFDFNANTTYTITLNMATNDWRNNFMGPQVIKLNSDGSQQITNGSLSVSNFQFVSRKTIKFNFKTNGTLSPYLLFRLYSTNYASTNTTAITGDSNWNLNSITIDKYTTSSGGSTGGGSTGGGSSIANDTLTCSNGLVLSSINYNSSLISIDNNYINSSGSLISNNNYGVVNYIPINSNTNYLLSKTTNTSDVPSYCLSSTNTSYGTCVAYNTRSSISFNSGSSTFLSFSLRKDEVITLSTCVNPLDNQNENTQQIIDNQNENTQQIIENSNDNTQQQIDNFNNALGNTCRLSNNLFLHEDFTSTYFGVKVDYSKGVFNFNGTTTAGGFILGNSSPSSPRVFKVGTFEPGRYILYIKKIGGSVSYPSGSSAMYFRLLSDNSIAFSTNITRDTTYYGHVFTLEQAEDLSIVYYVNRADWVFNNYQLQFQILRGDQILPFEVPGENICTNKLDDISGGINDTNNYLQDDSDPTIDDSTLNNVFGQVHFTDPLSYLLTLPTQLINKIVSLSDTCSSIDLGTLYGVHLTLPCINLENYLGSDLWGILDVILSVGLLAVILKNFYDTISNLLTLGGEKEAKEKFSMPTPMDFLAMILGGDNR